MFVLDTNVVSELRKARTTKINPGVAAWGTSVAPHRLFISAITLMELEMGVLSKERTDTQQARILRQWLNGTVLPAFTGRILPVDDSVAIACAGMHVPDRKSERDALIAATAAVRGMIVVTRNTQDFEGTGVQLLDPFTA